ncbi:MAG TPA: phosphoribosyltransferase family protein, partial [Candidatus Nitrosotalea sp.]|nr:phosphoribosyltransferase family protein [Candidatus Nitrosotalea sp.]
RVLIVEDVLTTGLSVRETIGVVERSGAQIIGLGVIIARGDKNVTPMPIHVLLDLPLVSYDEAECPQCREGVPIADPGSRRA